MIKEVTRKTEAAFENSGYWIHDHPKRVILMMLLIVVFLASQLPSIQFDTSTESFFEKDSCSSVPVHEFRHPRSDPVDFWIFKRGQRKISSELHRTPDPSL